MQKQDIILSVARYVVNNSNHLKGTLNNKYYFLLGGSSQDGRLGDYKIFRGYAVDILAEAIEKKKFFGDWVPSQPEQACNVNNSKLSLLKKSKTNIILSAEDFEETKNGLLIRVGNIAPKQYMKVLKNKTAFKEYSELVDLKSGFGENQKSSKQIIESIDDLFN